MPFIFPDTGLTVTSTGSLGVIFQNDGETLPEEITVTSTNSALAMTTFADLALVTADDETWQAVELTAPLPLDDIYTVRVYFDAVEVHSESVELPSPGKLRGRVLRQRLYEVLQAGYLAGAIEARPYGTPYEPSTVNIDFKGVAGIVVEVGAAYVDSIELRDYLTQQASVTIPLNVYGAMDDGEDTETVANGFEQVCGYLLGTDWKMKAFGMIQSQATMQGGEPQIQDDRNMAVIKGSISVLMRKGK